MLIPREGVTIIWFAQKTLINDSMFFSMAGEAAIHQDIISMQRWNPIIPRLEKTISKDLRRLNWFLLPYAFTFKGVPPHLSVSGWFNTAGIFQCCFHQETTLYWDLRASPRNFALFQLKPFVGSKISRAAAQTPPGTMAGYGRLPEATSLEDDLDA